MANLIASSGYKVPPEDIMRIFDAPALPYYHFMAYENMGLEITYQSMQDLAQLSDPTEELAGNVLSKKLNAPVNHYPIESITIHDLITDKKIKAQLPENIKGRDIGISPDYQKIACSYETEKGIELLIIIMKSGEVFKVNDVLLNDVMEDQAFKWFEDSSRLLLKTIPANRAEVREKPLIPESPIIEESFGKKSTNRTYQHLLENEHDKELFDYYFTAQLAVYDLNSKKLHEIAEPAIYGNFNLSPDNKLILISEIKKPYSYELPYWRFPNDIYVMDISGNTLTMLYQRPLQNQVPIGGTYRGPRYHQWQPLKDATLCWIEALDEGDPKNDVPFRDKVMRSSYPFTDDAEEMFRTEHRFSGINWSEIEDQYIYREYDRDKLWNRYWLFSEGDESAKLIIDQSVNNEYDYNGSIINKRATYGHSLFIRKGNFIYFNNAYGATPEGNKPFLAKLNVITLEQEILFRSDDDHFEKFYAFTDDTLDKIIIGSETTDTPRNYFILDLASGERKQITSYKNPHPEVTNLSKELIIYKRKDGTPLSGTLYLPPNYKSGDKLPLILHAYPQEFVDSSTAGQVTLSANKFIRISGASIIYLALQGYAVLSNASIPIIGDPETVNETFVEQLLMSFEAAVDYLDERAIIDRHRIGVIGHSYGAFMVANLLAQSDLCAAGVAKSGAYNRTLTPFGFQSERRTLWEAKDFYLKVSPFMHAEKIKEPVLLIHGEKDPNSGTYPIQSRRFYQAIKGNGGTARLVILPQEGHGYYARESNLHVLAEIIEWFNRYVRDKK